MYRSLCKSDRVDLVVVELVDTLWKSRGSPGTGSSEPVTAGWPAGVADALVQLRKRGIHLAIVSKNDERLIREIWPKVFGDGLRIDDFSAIRINWRKKSENMSEVLHELNLPSRSALFIDADPAERDAMRLAFPDIRTLGDLPYYIRRILLWSPETQGAAAPDDWPRGTDAMQVSSGSDAAASRSTYAQRALAGVGSAFDPPRRQLDELWSRAMNNDITPEEAAEIRRLSLGIAVADRGMRRVRPFSERNR
jgi:FkbH-like protein